MRKRKPSHPGPTRLAVVALALAIVVAAVVAALVRAGRAPTRHADRRADHTEGHVHGQQNLRGDGKVLWGSGFENGNMRIFREVHREGSGLAGSHQISTDVARTGVHSLKIVLPAPTGTSATDDVGRYQLVADMPDGQPGEERWYGLSIYLPEDWRIGEIRSTRENFLLLAGFRYTGTRRNGPGSNLAIARVDGVPKFTTGTDLAGTVGAFWYGHHDLGPVVTRRWIDFVFHIRWSTGSDGLREEWRDGAMIGRYHGATLGFDSPFEYRLGPYEGVGVDRTRTLYVDNARAGTSYAAVDPSR